MDQNNEWWVRNNFDLHHKTNKCETDCVRVALWEDYEGLRAALEAVVTALEGWSPVTSNRYRSIALQIARVALNGTAETVSEVQK